MDCDSEMADMKNDTIILTLWLPCPRWRCLMWSFLLIWETGLWKKRNPVPTSIRSFPGAAPQTPRILWCPPTTWQTLSWKPWAGERWVADNLGFLSLMSLFPTLVRRWLGGNICCTVCLPESVWIWCQCRPTRVLPGKAKTPLLSGEGETAGKRDLSWLS